MIATAIGNLRAFTRIVIGVMLIAVMAACGGGGSPTAPPPSISISPATLITSVAPGVSATLSVRATVTDTKVFAGATFVYAYIVDPQHLLSGTVNISPIDSINYSVTVYTSATLAPGRYQGAFQIQLCKDNACAAQFSVSPLSLPYDFTVTNYPISLSAGSDTAASLPLGGTIPADITFNVVAQAQTWTASTKASWLRVNSGSGKGNGSFTVSFIPAGLAIGQYNDLVTLTAADGQTANVPVSLSLATPTLSATSNVVTLGGSKGRDWTGQSIQLTLNTGNNTWPWTLSGVPTWLSASPSSGVVSQTATSVSMAPIPSQISPGSVTAIVNVNALDSGDSLNLPLTVNMNADQRKLLASTWGVGFSSTPTGNNLSRTLTVRDNFGGAIAWTAVSDSAWLQASTSGATPGSLLTLTADPTSLPNTAISYANVTISTNVAGVAPAVVRVGLWKDSTAAVASTYLTTAYKHIAADAIRPYVYATNGATSIDVYNAYTAQLVRTLTGVGSTLGSMAVSPDGSLLYALDTAAGKISVVNLTTMTVSTPWTLSSAVGQTSNLLVVRPNGQEVVLVSNGTAYRNGSSLGTTPFFGSLTAPSDGSSVYIQDQGNSPASVGAYDLDYSAMSGGTLMVSRRANGWSINGSSNGGDIAISPDGTRLYTATGAPYTCSSVNPQTLTLVGSLPGGAPYPNNVDVTQDGRVICGVNGIYSTYDFWVHTAAGALIRGYKVAGYAQGLLAGQMVTTPDGFVVVALTSDPRIAFVAIGP